ncbi:retroviral-like aspartic protease family protein [Chitinophaga sancti]|uniref:Aspartyl protease family protein n=1 Tax=Chitinophaga sancti TaxID=1004 RepID=A0ABZ0XA26_9BACT|nr:aspartyl protease family protein [Chitinophaga sancti]WQD60420.1 aspartyl protease family protein [Chitinophaga sancti]WQG87452.1 aspartyl protease family protein [Chitinophaga sancti]
MKKLLFYILIALPLLSAAQTPPTTAEPVAILPFRIYSHSLIISASLSSSEDSLHFIFDTGAEATTLSNETAKKLKLETKDDGGLSGSDDIVIRVPTSTINLLYFGKARLPLVKVFLEPLQEFQKSPIHIDGIIGVDMLKMFIIQIDYTKSQILLFRPGKTPMNVPGKRLAMTLNFDTPVIEAVIELPDGRSLGSRYHFITGGDYGMLFNWPFVEKYQLKEILPIVSSDKVGDLYQELTYMNTIIPYLAFGAVRMEKVSASYCKQVNDVGGLTEVAGSIGSYIWAQFRTITINYKQREIYLDK